jgi:hypothetical protein
MSGKPSAAPSIANQKLDKPKVEIADNANPQETETGKLKAELALVSQAEKIKSIERSKSPKVTVTQRKIQTRNDLNRRTPATIASREVRPAPVTYTPRPIMQNSRYYPTRVAYVPRLQAATRVSTPISTKEAVDPMEEWAKISRLGSYGGIELASNTIPNTASKTNEEANSNTIDTTVNEQPTPPTIIPRATLVSAVSGRSSSTDNSLEVEPLYAEEAVVINGEPVRQLTVGASAPGKIVTPLIWGKRSTNNTSQKSPTPTEGEKFIVQLVEPLTTESGFIILPKGSQIIAQVANIQKSGLVELQATQVVIDGKEYLFPPGAISVRGNSGQPLIASMFGDKGGEIAARDAETFVVGSLAKIGKVLNQPKEEQVSTSSGFGGTTTFSSTRRGDANILGAVLEGGFEPLTQQIQRRNQQALSEIQQREEVWYVDAGTNVQVFVNQSFQFENFER